MDRGRRPGSPPESRRLAEADSTAAYWDSGQGRFAASAIFHIEPPRELAGLSDTQIEQTAAQRTG
jgi:hypothetical protein